MNKPAALRALLALLTVSMLIAACSGAAAPTAPGSEAPPSATPGGSGGGSDPGTGSGEPIGGAPGDPGVVDPGQPRFVVPQPGQQNVHPVSIEEMDARVDGRRAVLNARWWSGIEPCTVLDSVAWKRDGKTITISVREGSGQGDLVCIDIAMYKATLIDLGELEPGEYTVIAGEGNAAPIAFTIA
jgi:ABC-type transport system substrate-binding protein